MEPLFSARGLSVVLYSILSYMVEILGFLDSLDTGDDVMADKGLVVAFLLFKHHSGLWQPLKRYKNQKQFTAEAGDSTRSVANLRIHVESAVQ